MAEICVLQTKNLADRLRVSAEMLIAGVAFRRDGKTWDVFSHWGDELGTLSTFDVCEAACMLKAQGFKASSDFGGMHPKKDGVLSLGYNN